MALSEKEIKEAFRECIQLNQPVVDAAGLTRTQWRGLIKGLDDWFESNRLAAKAAMEAEAGVTIDGPTAKLVGKVWLKSKWEGE